MKVVDKQLTTFGFALSQHCLKHLHNELAAVSAEKSAAARHKILLKIIDPNLGISPAQIVAFMIENGYTPDSFEGIATEFRTAKGCELQPLYDKHRSFKELIGYILAKYPKENNPQIDEIAECGSIEKLDKEYNPLTFAIRKNDLELIDKLLAFGLEKNRLIKLKKPTYPILEALPHPGLVEELIKRGFYLPSLEPLVDDFSATPEQTNILLDSIPPANLEKDYKLLVKENIHPTLLVFLKTHLKFPLHAAAKSGYYTYIQFLAELKAKYPECYDLNAQDENGNTPLAIVCQQPFPYNEDEIDYLLEKGHRLHIKNNDGLSPALTLLLRESDSSTSWYSPESLIGYFKEHEEEIKNFSNWIPCMNFSLRGQESIIAFLINNNCRHPKLPYLIMEQILKNNRDIARLQDQLTAISAKQGISPLGANTQNPVSKNKNPGESIIAEATQRLADLKGINKKWIETLAAIGNFEHAINDLHSSDLLVEENNQQFAALERDESGSLTESSSIQANNLLWKLIQIEEITGPKLFEAMDRRGIHCKHHTMYWNGQLTKKAETIEDKFQVPIDVFFTHRGNVDVYFRLQKIDSLVHQQQEVYMVEEQRDLFLNFENTLLNLPKEGSYVITHALPAKEGGTAVPPTAISQEELSYRCGMGSASGWLKTSYEKTEMQTNREAFLALPENGAHKGFIWVNTFSNVNTSIPSYDSQILRCEDPLNPGQKATFPNTEFYYQYCKLAYFVNKMVEGNEKQAWIKTLFNCITDPKYTDPKEAFSFGRQSVPGYNADEWKKDAKDLIAMKSGLYAKFTQNPLLLAELVLTGKDSRPLVQMKSDDYWGTGETGDGKNFLGVCLMEVREDLIAGRKTPIFTL